MLRGCVSVTLACCGVALHCHGVVTYEERLDFFNGDNDLPRFFNTAKCIDKEGSCGVVVESSRRTFDMVYDVRPCKEPVPGFDELVLESESQCAERIEVAVREFPGGPTLKFAERWTPTMRFKTKLDQSKRYQIRMFRVTRRKPNIRTNAAWRISFKSLTGVFTTGEADALRFEVITGNPFHGVRDEVGETARLAVRNLSERPVAFKADLELQGPFGERMPFGPSGVVEGNGSNAFPLPATSRKGVWKVSGLAVASDGSTNRMETRFARVDCHERTPKVPRGTFRLGMNYHMARYPLSDRRKTMAALVAIGAKLARADIGLKMRTVQANGPDEWNWDGAERRLKLLEEAGISVSTSLFPIPRWAARPEVVEKARLEKQWRYEVLSLPPDGLFERYCERIAKRFKGRLDYYEIGNEWDLNFRNPVEEAVEIQRQAYRGIKRADPDVLVLSNGWAGANDLRSTRFTPRRNFQKEFLVLSHGDCYDVHTTHCHGDFTSYERRINSFKKLREETGTHHKPWFSNESAISSIGGEREAAATVWKKIVFARAMGSVDYVWYNLRGTGWDPKDPEQGYGLVTAGYLPRETFVSFAALATVMRGCDSCREVWRSGKLRGYELRGNRGVTLVAWNDETADGSPGLEVRTDARDAELVDLFGNRHAVEVKNGAATFDVGKLPAALVLKGAQTAVASDEDVYHFSISGRRVAEIPTDGLAHAPQFVLDSSSQVWDFYEAIPGRESHLWQGPHDLSAKVWLACEPANILVRIDVRDDVQVEGCGRENSGDSASVLFRAAKGEGRRFKMGRPVSRSGDVTRYELRFSTRALGLDDASLANGFFFNVLLTDDDGDDGQEATMELDKWTFWDSASGVPVRLRAEHCREL